MRANELVETKKAKIISSINKNIGRVITDTNQLFGGGKASLEIAKFLANKL